MRCCKIAEKVILQHFLKNLKNALTQLNTYARITFVVKETTKTTKRNLKNLKKVVDKLRKMW